MFLTYILSYACIFIIFIFSIRYYWSRRKLYLFSWKIRGPMQWPIIGNALLFIEDPTHIPKLLEKFRNDYKSSYRLWFGPIMVFVVHSPEEIALILNSPRCLEKNDAYNFFHSILGTGLFTARARKWKLHRKALLPAFNQKTLNSYLKIFQEQSNILAYKLKKIAGKGEFDIFIPTYSCTLDVVCETVLGCKLYNQDKESVFVTHIEIMKHYILSRLFNIWQRMDFLDRLFRNPKIISAKESIRQYTKKILIRKKADIKENFYVYKNDESDDDSDDECDEVIKKKSFIDQLLRINHENFKFTEEECIDEIMTMIVAGSETTATVLSFVVLMLGMHPEIQEKCINEVDKVFANLDRLITVEDLHELKYLERVIKETMRLFPAAMVIGRKTSEEVDLKTIVIPKGVSIIIDIYSLHRDPEIWSDPLVFNPDRFLPDETSNRHPFSYIPFSAGPRNCFGIHYAWKSMKIILSMLLRNFKMKTVRYDRVEDVKLSFNILSKPVNGFMIEIELRNQIK